MHTSILRSSTHSNFQGTLLDFLGFISGSASDLHLLLWNRDGTDGLGVRGEEALLDLWRDSVHIRWED